MEQDNRSSLDKLRELFSNFEDFESDLYQLYEVLLNTSGVNLTFSFNESTTMDFTSFFQKHTLWDMFKDSVRIYDSSYTSLRMNMYSPWFVKRDCFNLEITSGNQTIFITNHKNNVPNVMDLESLLSSVNLFFRYPTSSNIGEQNHSEFVREFKKTKKFTLKLKRTKTDSSLRTFLEKQNIINDTGAYRVFIETKLQKKVFELLSDTDLLEETLRLHLQTRLALWGFRYKDLLSNDDLINQFKIVKVAQVFPNLLEARLFLDYLSFNDNNKILDEIENHTYKHFLMKFLNKIENKENLILQYNGINLEGKPEFAFNL